MAGGTGRVQPTRAYCQGALRIGGLVRSFQSLKVRAQKAALH